MQILEQPTLIDERPFRKSVQQTYHATTVWLTGMDAMLSTSSEPGTSKTPGRNVRILDKHAGVE